MTTRAQRLLAFRRNAAQGLPAVLGSSGGAGSLVGERGGRPTAPPLDPDHYQPVDGTAFDTNGSATVLAGATAVLSTVNIPVGMAGVLKGWLAGLNIGSDPTQWPNLAWTIKLNGSAVAPWQGLVFGLGTNVASDIHLRIPQGSILTLEVKNNAAGPLDCVGRLKGWWYPFGG